MRLKIVKARKNHICDVCKKKIRKGEKFILFYHTFAVPPGKYHIECWNKEHPLFRVEV